MILSNRLAPCVDPRSLADFQSTTSFPRCCPRVAGKCRENSTRSMNRRFCRPPPPPPLDTRFHAIPPSPVLRSTELTRLVERKENRGKIASTKSRNFHFTRFLRLFFFVLVLSLRGNTTLAHETRAIPQRLVAASDGRVRWHASPRHRSSPIIVARPLNRGSTPLRLRVEIVERA